MKMNRSKSKARNKIQLNKNKVKLNRINKNILN